MKAVISLLVCLVSPGQSHVSLKYPPARHIDLDFLDSFRTSGDCGVEAGDSRTSLLAGSQLNLTWHLGYPHGGGYRLELVEGSQARLLVPPTGDESSFQTLGGVTAQSSVVTLPDVECEECYLRFQRQATEWGRNYKFRSCADIRLVRGLSDGERCSGQGTWDGGRCRCNRLRLGDRCQYQTQCQDDGDCNGPKGQGQCVTVDSRIFPYSECYCADGWFGPQCQHQTTWGPGQGSSFNREEFKEVSLGGDVELLWRVKDSTEVEIIMTAPTLSWLGLGWRPANTDQTCRDFPAGLGRYTDRTLHAMDCMDIVLGAARGGLGRVADYYTRDRSTPRLDSVWGGQDDLLSSYAWEEDGRTGMRFVRAMAGGDEADHDIQGNMMIIWAHGQQTSFYQEDQLKFHSKPFSGISAVEFPVSSSLGLTPVNLGILVSCVLIVVLMLIQICQNCDRKLKFLTPFSYKSFSPEN